MTISDNKDRTKSKDPNIRLLRYVQQLISGNIVD